MGQIPDGSATAKQAVRRAIQLRRESVRAPAKRYGAGSMMVQRSLKRETTADAAMAPRERRSIVPSVEGRAMIAALRRHTPLPPDDCIPGLRPAIPRLARSSLHRCLERRGISRLPEVRGGKPEKRRSAGCAIGCVHIDLAEVSTAGGKLCMSVAIDRVSKFALVRLVTSAGKIGAAQFLRDCTSPVPHRILAALTDDRIESDAVATILLEAEQAATRAAPEIETLSPHRGELLCADEASPRRSSSRGEACSSSSA